jgi:4-amino-4-deoxy-L-arabinose transferase-like glycosyltransferase
MVRRLGILAAIGMVCALYLADLTGMGMVGPDEPRYAAIGRAMARSGDWVTPRLWGQPWFEKPPLLYWMTAAGFRLGLDPDLAPRLPVALLSLVFLWFFWWRIGIEWGRRAAFCATAMLATSAGWLTYSHVAVTDLPMAAFFSAAVLLSMPWIARGERTGLAAAAACLGLATLAKGLVPLLLFLPVLVLGWRHLRDWLRPGPIAAFAVCALPWYLLITLRHGREFLRVFFVEQQFARLGSAVLQHVQPFWYYVPIFLLLICPWIALPGLVPVWRKDPRVRVLAAVVIFGFIFFSAALNKLPGYLIPLLPAAFALAGIGVSRVNRAALATLPSMMLLGILPVASGIAPGILAHGLSSSHIPWTSALLWLMAACAAGWILVRITPAHALDVTAGLAVIGFLWFQFATFPGFDAAASARPEWLRNHPECSSSPSRNLRYGLSYYAQKEIPDCTVLDPSGTRVVR